MEKSSLQLMIKVNNVGELFSIINYILISSIEERLPASMFLRIHRSFIVALSKIDAWSQNIVQTGNQNIPAGSNYKETFLKRVNTDLK